MSETVAIGPYNGFESWLSQQLYQSVAGGAGAGAGAGYIALKEDNVVVAFFKGRVKCLALLGASVGVVAVDGTFGCLYTVVLLATLALGQIIPRFKGNSFANKAEISFTSVGYNVQRIFTHLFGVIDPSLDRLSATCSQKKTLATVLSERDATSIPGTNPKDNSSLAVKAAIRFKSDSMQLTAPITMVWAHAIDLLVATLYIGGVVVGSVIDRLPAPLYSLIRGTEYNFATSARYKAINKLISRMQIGYIFLDVFRIMGLSKKSES